MDAKPRLILALLMSSVMVAMVTFLVTVLDLGFQSGFFPKWIVFHRLADRRRHRLPDHAARASPDRADRRFARRPATALLPLIARSRRRSALLQRVKLMVCHVLLSPCKRRKGLADSVFRAAKTMGRQDLISHQSP
jgi:hypothetical protein